jgi:hypothetical protein
VGRCGLDASGSGQGPEVALVNMIMRLQIPQKIVHLLKS